MSSKPLAEMPEWCQQWALAYLNAKYGRLLGMRPLPAIPDAQEGE